MNPKLYVNEAIDRTSINPASFTLGALPVINKVPFGHILQRS